MPKDFLDEVIEERTKKHPDFPQLIGEAAARRFVDEFTKMKDQDRIKIFDSLKDIFCLNCGAILDETDWHKCS